MSKRPSEAFFGLGRFVPAAIRYIKGDTGAAATVAVGETTTLPAGSPATVQNVGDENNAVFKFGIPQGGKGDKGDPGTSIPLPVSVANGGTGAITAAAARANLGVPAVVAPSTADADAGKAADAKATGEALTGKLDGTGLTNNSGQLVAQDFVTAYSYGFAGGKYATAPANSGAALTAADISDSQSALGAALAIKANVSDLPAYETWTFVVDDGQGGTSTVTKQVAVYAAAQGAGA